VASIEKRTGGNGKPEYRARWRDGEGKSRRSRWFDRKHDAERHRATVEADLHRGAYVDPNNPVTVAEYAREWIANRPHRAMSRLWYANLLKNHIEATPLGRRPLVKVKPSEVQAWVTTRAQILSPYNLRVHVGALRSIFATALLDGVISRNPVQPTNRLSLPKREHRPVTPLLVEQVRALADAMPARFQAMALTQAGLGLRVGELLALRIKDVDFLRRFVHVEHQLERETLERVPPKTPKSRRDIPLPQVVAEALAEHIRQWPPAADGTLFTPSEPGDGFRRGSTPRTRARPDRVHHSVYEGHFREAVRRAGLPAGTSTHDLRHHFASVLLHAGESVHAVAERLGHTTPELVLKVYGHLMPNQEDRTRRAIDAAWSEAVERPVRAVEAD